ncbi:MAG: DNA primase small subunit PriS [Candidatus Verstraetearchaeota archaeon]|nr:DNA primase small subunit PriS [Candidatus Verstraetearchaeota archaeon]
MHEIVRNEFTKYYSGLGGEDLKVPDMPQREFAFLQFGGEVMIRHMKFLDTPSLKRYIVENTPAHIYHSSAYYKTPEATDMNEKGWLGADLVFDVDSDHIRTECKERHDKWRCMACGKEGAGFPPESCPNCGMKKIDTRTWICEDCLEAAKKEVTKIIDEYLVPDFGVSDSDFEVFFSGHRGYHIHVRSQTFRTLSGDGRREIADYVRGIGLDIRLHGFREAKNEILVGPDMKDGGWRGRVARAVYEFVNRASLEDLKLVVAPTVAKSLFENKEKFLKSISSDPPYWGGLKGYTLESLEKIAIASIKNLICNIDERVTIDSKRLIRCPNSLHGKSGLRTLRVDYSGIDNFDPLKEAVAFRHGSIRIYVKEAPRVRIGDEELGPLKDKTLEVPLALGLYLICRGAAEPR